MTTARLGVIGGNWDASLAGVFTLDDSELNRIILEAGTTQRGVYLGSYTKHIPGNRLYSALYGADHWSLGEHWTLGGFAGADTEGQGFAEVSLGTHWQFDIGTLNMKVGIGGYSWIVDIDPYGYGRGEARFTIPISSAEFGIYGTAYADDNNPRIETTVGIGVSKKF